MISRTFGVLQLYEHQLSGPKGQRLTLGPKASNIPLSIRKGQRLRFILRLAVCQAVIIPTVYWVVSLSRSVENKTFNKAPPDHTSTLSSA